MDGLIAYALAKKYADKVGQSILDAGFKVQVEQDRSILNRTGEQMTLYLLPKESSLSSDTYDEYVYTTKWEQVGSTDIELDYNDLSNIPTVTIGNTTNDLTGALIFASAEFKRTLYGNNGLALADTIFESFFDVYISQPYDFDLLESNYIHTGCYMETKSRALHLPVEFSDSVDKLFIFHFGENYYPYEKFVRVVTYSTGTKIKNFIQYFSLRSGSSSSTYEVYNATNWQEIGGGSEIASGVVNQNGTITFTDSDGNTFTTTGDKLMTSGNQQISMGYDSGGFYFLFDDGQEVVNNGSN